MEAEIADRKKAEEKFRLVVESAPHGMIVLGQDDRIALVNSRMRKSSGSSGRNCWGRRWKNWCRKACPRGG